MQANHIAGISRASLALAIVLLAWVASKSTWVFLQGKLTIPTADIVALEAPKQQVDHAAVIRNAHLFGVEKQKVKPRKKPVKRRLTGTLSQATLVGVLAEGDGSGSAVIMLKSQKSNARVYHDGDELPTIGQIHQVWQDHIVVNVAGSLESLYLKKAKANSSFGEKKRRGSDNTSSAMGKFRQMVIQNPTQLGKHFAARPIKRGGKMIGYSVSSKGAYRSLFREIGLRNGDIITSVNGTELTSTSNALKVYEAIQDASSITATILRRGRNLTITRAIY